MASRNRSGFGSFRRVLIRPTVSFVGLAALSSFATARALRWVRSHFLLTTVVSMAGATAGASAVAYADGPYYHYTPTDYVYESAPGGGYGWRYKTYTRVEYYQYPDYEFVSERQHWWNIEDVGTASDCQLIYWQNTDGASIINVFYESYDYYNTPIYKTFNSQDAFNQAGFTVNDVGDHAPASMAYMWTHYGQGENYCAYNMQAGGYWTDGGGWLIGTYKYTYCGGGKGGGGCGRYWAWDDCRHNAGDNQCPLQH